jgi:hypothetical protein
MIKQAWALYFIIILLTFMLGIKIAKAGELKAISRADSNVLFTITDNECVSFPILSDGSTLREATVYDAGTGKTLMGCAIDYGMEVELQFINDAEKKHYRFIIPSADFL